MVRWSEKWRRRMYGRKGVIGEFEEKENVRKWKKNRYERRRK